MSRLTTINPALNIEDDYILYIVIMIWAWWSLIPPNTEARTIHMGNTFKSIDLSKTSCYLSLVFEGHIGKGYTEWSRQWLGAKMATRRHLHQRLSSVSMHICLTRLQCNKNPYCFKVLHNRVTPILALSLVAPLIHYLYACTRTRWWISRDRRTSIAVS